MATEHHKTDDEIYRLRHSTAHVLANAVLDFFPDAKVAIGPPIAEGFYYDFDLGRDDSGNLRTFTPEDLEKIEERSPPQPLWDTPGMLLLLVGLLSTEWLLRKRFSLL